MSSKAVDGSPGQVARLAFRARRAQPAEALPDIILTSPGAGRCGVTGQVVVRVRRRVEADAGPSAAT